MQLFYLTFFLLSLSVFTRAGDLRCLRPGAFVLSLYKDFRYFPGQVESLGESIDVTFQNGKQQSYSSYSNDVIIDDMPNTSELTGGSRVLARRPKSTSFEPGFVNGSIEGVNDTFLVNYDSGDSLARNIMDIRVATKPSSCMNEKGIYIGCFENVLNNYLSNYYAVNPTDVATCNWACYSRGFNFAGLQNGTWCFCGNHVNDSLKVDDNECNIACRDSREDVCGGYRRMTVYWTGAESSDNITNLPSEFTNTDADNAAPKQDAATSEIPIHNECSDIYDTAQCNMWAEDSRCIHDPDWMIANCKKSCYACEMNDLANDKSSPNSDSSPTSYATNVIDQSQSSPPNLYPSTTPPQSPASYQSSVQSPYTSTYYPPPQNIVTQPSAKKSSHETSNTPRSAGYLGCYKDSPSSHDLDYLADIKPLSIRACITKCKSMRFPYAGVQSSSSCYCGLHYGKYGETAHEDCNTPCEGESSEMCGGIMKNSLYNTGFALKVKVTENASTRKIRPSPKYPKPSSPALDIPGTVRSLYQAPSPHLDYQPHQSSEQQPYSQQQLYSSNTASNPPAYDQGKPVYNPPASATQTTYNQVRYDQATGYPPAATLNNQASNPQQSLSANPQPPDYSPRDSSSYGWRDTFVKLRAQEQQRWSKTSGNKLRPKKAPKKSRKLVKDVFAKKMSGKKWRSRKHAKKFRKFKHVSRKHFFGNTAKFRKIVGAKINSKRLRNQFLSNSSRQFQSKHSRHIFKVNMKNSKKRKSFAKPGVFLRKKAWKGDSNFLAFLPHEVTKDESLLENVYNMLSHMLKKLRKHKRNAKTRHSMKTLKQYLKLPGNRGNETISSKNPEGLRQLGTASKVAREMKNDAKKLKLEELSSILHGQKQLDKENQRRPVSGRWRNGDDVTYIPRDNASMTSTNESFSDSLSARKRSYVYKVIVRPESKTSDEAVASSFSGTLAVGLHNHSANEYNSAGLSSKKPQRSKSDFSRNSSPSLKQDNDRDGSNNDRNASEDNRNESGDHWSESEDHRNESEDHRNESEERQSESEDHRNETKKHQSELKDHRNESKDHRSESDRNEQKEHRSESKDHRNKQKQHRSESKYHRKVPDIHRHESDDRRNKSEDLRNESKINQNYAKTSENENKEHASHLKNKSKFRKWVTSKDDRKTRQKARTSKTKFLNMSHRKSHGDKKKLKSMVKLNGNKILKIDAPLMKEMEKTNSTSDDVVEKSDEDIISTIVNVLEKEKNKRKQRKKEKERKHRYRKSGEGWKRISKKGDIQKHSEKGYNLMEEEENYIDILKGRS